MTRAMAAVMLAAVMGGCGSSGDDGAATAPATRFHEVSTEDIGSGKVKLSEMSTESLQWLLNDLDERLKNDRDSHEGKPGPDADYLTHWRTVVAAELASRMNVGGGAATRSGATMPGMP